MLQARCAEPSAICRAVCRGLRPLPSQQFSSSWTWEASPFSQGLVVASVQPASLAIAVAAHTACRRPPVEQSLEPPNVCRQNRPLGLRRQFSTCSTTQTTQQLHGSRKEHCPVFAIHQAIRHRSTITPSDNISRNERGWDGAQSPRR